MPPASTSAATRALILGSTSVYRRELLSRLRLPFTVESPNVDETPLASEQPAEIAGRLAAAKAAAIAHAHPAAIVIGSDQVADLDGEPLGKPGNHANAFKQLRRMSGRTIIFHTAVTVMCIDSGFIAHTIAPEARKARDWASPCWMRSKATTRLRWSACR
jgi:septum formation protein